MAEYIEREAAKRAACNYVELFPGEYEAIEARIDKIPVADVAPVRHGRWKPFEIDGRGRVKRWLCTYCHETSTDGGKYCPNCGAKMDGGEENA